jgi:predicted PurR-regulated permease PerM
MAAANSSPPEGTESTQDRMARLVRTCVVVLLLAVVIFSREIAVPALAAVLVAIALFPIVNRMVRLAIPRALASVSVLIALVALSCTVIYAVRQPLAQLAARGPELLATARELIARLAGQPLSRDVAQHQAPTELSELMAPVAAGLTASLVAVGTSLILCYFILTCGTGVGRAALAAVRGRHDRRSWLRVFGSIRRHAAYYLQLVTVINVAFGVITGLLLTVMGVKDAAAYGVIAGLMNFIPIIGALITTGVLLAGSIAEQGASAAILAPAAAFLLLHLLESQFITPTLLGRRLQLNPLIVIASIMVGAAAWGIGGAFLAVPILTSVKIALDAHPGFHRWGQVLGRGALADFDIDEARRRRLRRRRPRGRPAVSRPPSGT